MRSYQREITPSAPQAKERRCDARTCAVLERDGPNITLTDRDTAVYLHAIHRINIASAARMGRRGFKIVMYDPEHRAEELVIEFINSESSLFADGLRRVNKILHSFGGNGCGGGGGGGGNERGREE